MIFVPLASLSHPLGQLQDRVKLVVDFRERFERRLNKDFDSSANDDRNDLFSRWRFGLETQPQSGPKMTLIYQYAHDLVQTRKQNFSIQNTDMKVAQLAGKVIGDWKYVAGRQRITVGDERLIGSSDWNNISRSYDGLQLNNSGWSVFGAKIGLNSPELHYAKAAGVTRRLGTSFNNIFFKHDQLAGGSVEIYTLNRTDSGSLGGLDWQYDVAYQFGRNQGLDHRAWALHGYLGHKFTPSDNLFAVGDYASGSGSSTKSETFDYLYPTVHGKWGIADMVGWRNIALLSAGAEHSFTRDTKLKIQYWKYWLANSHDGWYSAAGSLNKSGSTTLIDPTGNSGKDLGSEIDIELTTKIGPVMYGIGVASFAPGSFVNNVAGHNDRQTWGYVQANYKF